METVEKLNWVTVILFLTMGVTHLIGPLLFGLAGVGLFIFGIFYASLGFLVHFKKENKAVKILSIIIPLIGGTLATLSLLVSFWLYLFLVCILFDPPVIVLRIYIYKRI